VFIPPEFILPGGLRASFMKRKKKKKMKPSILQYKAYAEFSVKASGFNKRSDKDT